MKLTEENKRSIDNRSFEELLRHNRYAPSGDPWFEGETGKYWLKRMGELRDKDPGGAVATSKRIGWD